MENYPAALIAIALLVLIILSSAIRILREYERGVIFRLGRLIGGDGIKGPGFILLIPVIDKMVKVSLRTVVLDVPPQDIITSDNVSIKVNAVVYFRVVEPQKAIVQVEISWLRHLRFRRPLCAVYWDNPNWMIFFHNGKRLTTGYSRSLMGKQNPGE